MNFADFSGTVQAQILEYTRLEGIELNPGETEADLESGKNKKYGSTVEKYSSIWKNKYWPGDSRKLNYKLIQRNQKLIPFFNPQTSKLQPQTVVLHGPAGAGKTTLAKKLMLDWTEGNLKSIFRYAFYLSCKELNQMEPCTCAELISKDCPELHDAIVEVLDPSHQRVLIIIDGFDELRFPPGALISDLCGDWKNQKPVAVLVGSLLVRNVFPRATLLITTRTWALRELWPLLRQPLFIEIQGFSQEDRKEYFLQHFQDEDHALQAFELMESNATLFSMASAPMVCWIVATCLKLQMEKGEDPTPTCETTTSLLLNFLCSQFMWAPDSCPSQDLQAPVKALCHLAAEGVWAQVSVFGGEDLKRLGVTECEIGPFLDKNILQKSRDCAGYYSFIHFIVQQFFAAMFYVLRTKEEEDQESPKGDIGDTQKLFSNEEMLKNPSLIEVGYFLFGLSNEKRARELEKMFGCPVTTELKQEFLRWKVQCSENKSSVLGMREIGYFYESQEEAFVKEAMAHFKEVSLKLKNETDVTQALFCLKDCRNLQKMSLKVEKGLFLENDTFLGGVSWDERSEHDDLILSLWEDLCPVVSSNEDLSILDVSYSFLSDTSVRILRECMASVNCNLQKVMINDVSPVDAYRDFCIGLVSKKTLTHLVLEGSIHGEKLMLALYELLRHKRCSLQYLRLGSCLASTEEWSCFFRGLTVNQSLLCLNLRDTALLEEDVKLLCTALKHPACSLQMLSLQNCHLTEASCQDLCSVLIINQKLTHLSLAMNNLGDDGMQLLCKGLCFPDCKLQTLALWACGLTALCCKDLASALVNSNSLESLDLSLNKLGQSGTTLLFDVLKQKNVLLQKLKVTIEEPNVVTEKLLEVKETNPQLTIDCSNPRIDEPWDSVFVSWG